MMKRILRWLCRHQIAEACAPLLIEKVTAELRHQVDAQVQYLNGYTKGSQETFDAIEKEVRGRLGGASDVITMEDVARAKKGVVH